MLNFSNIPKGPIPIFTWFGLFLRQRVVNHRRAEMGVGRNKMIGAEVILLFRQANNQVIVSKSTRTNPNMASATLLTSIVSAKLRSLLDLSV